MSALEARFLSSLSQRYEVVRVSPDDTRVLQDKLAVLERETHDPDLQGALRSLERILGEAQADSLGLFFQPTE